MDPTLALTCELIAKPSLTPEDAQCQALLISRLEAIGFHCESMPFSDVTNLYCTRGSGSPSVLFIGHTDVVPPGPLSQWQSPPFTPTIRNGLLYGRGAADMKGSIAAFIVAIEQFIKTSPQHTGSISLIITSDEEGPSTHGTAKVIETLKQRHIHFDYGIVGEPSSQIKLGDTIKVGRRGSLSGKLQILGKQGHIAYPHLAQNPIHQAFAALHALTTTSWDQGNRDFQPTSLQFSNIHAGTGALNVIPGMLSADFNLRYNTEHTPEQLQQRIETILNDHHVNYQIEWRHSGRPFLSKRGKLLDTTQAILLQELGYQATPATNGGTSDGRFAIEICPELIELGPINDSIHQIDEHVSVEDLPRLSKLYELILKKLLT